MIKTLNHALNTHKFKIINKFNCRNILKIIDYTIQRLTGVIPAFSTKIWFCLYS